MRITWLIVILAVAVGIVSLTPLKHAKWSWVIYVAFVVAFFDQVYSAYLRRRRGLD